VTVLGKLAAGAPDPATLSNFLVNMRAFAVMGALFSPPLGVVPVALYLVQIRTTPQLPAVDWNSGGAPTPRG
jgi:hypothetical protein